MDDFQVRNGPEQPLRLQWRLPSLSSAAALQRELQSQSTLLQLDTPPVSASGHAALIGCLSLPKMCARRTHASHARRGCIRLLPRRLRLAAACGSVDRCCCARGGVDRLARHPALCALQGNPKAISLAVSLLLPDAVTPRPIGEVGTLLERQCSGERRIADLSSADDPLADSCRAVLEQLHTILSPPSPERSPAGERSPPPTPPPAHGGFGGMASPTPEAEPPVAGNEPVALAGEDSRRKLPASLVLKKDEFMRMMGGEPRWIGSGSLGAVYEVALRPSNRRPR